ncbi:MAG: molecular chaperone DnaK, partial [Asticcacaulis sp.]
DLKAARDADDAEDIRTKSQAVIQASMKLGEAMYSSQSDADKADESADDGVVDAEFEEVDGDSKKSA